LTGLLRNSTEAVDELFFLKRYSFFPGATFLWYL